MIDSHNIKESKTGIICKILKRTDFLTDKGTFAFRVQQIN